jgi:tetratricopeptide (TPR) repeat protein
MVQKRQPQQPAFSQELRRHRSMAGSGHILQIILLTLVCLAVYFNSLSNGFVFDDLAVIVENEHIKDLVKNLPAFLDASYFKIAGGEASYRPLATLSYYLLYGIAGLNPFYYHLASLILHLINAVLVYLLVDSILRNNPSALMAGLLFTCHPALTEAVACISYNEDLLAAVFFLLALIFYLKSKPTNLRSGLKNYGLSLLFFLFGLLSKEMAIALSAIVVLYDLTFRQTGRPTRLLTSIRNTMKARGYLYLGYLGVSLFYLFIRFFIFSNPRDTIKPFYGNILERIIYLPGHIFDFIRLAGWPMHLNADYVFSYPSGFFDLSNLLGFVVVGGLVWFSFIIYKQAPEIFFGIWWFLITLFPVYNLIEIFNPFADRYLYIPIIGFCLIVPVSFNAVANRVFHKPKALKTATLTAGTFILCIYATVTITRNRDWRDGLTLWSKTVASSPGSFIAHGSLGRAYQDQGMVVEAIREYEQAIEIYAGDYKAHYNLGVVYDRQGDLENAVLHYKKVIEIYPQYFNAHFNLGNIYHKQGFLDAAVVHYQKVLELHAEDFEARNNLGVAYAKQGKLDQAISEWEHVLDIDPQNISAKDNIRKAKEVISPSN